MRREKNTNYDESHAIEPRTNVGETPQQDAKFERIDEVFNEEQSAQFTKGSVSMCDCDIRDFVHFLSW